MRIFYYGCWLMSSLLLPSLYALPHQNKSAEPITPKVAQVNFEKNDTTNDSLTREPSATPKTLAAKSFDWTLQVGQEDEACKRLISVAENCGGYLFSRSSGLLQLRLPMQSVEKCSAKLFDSAQVIAKSMQVLDLQADYNQNLTKLQTKEHLLKDYFSLLDSSNASSWVSVSRAVQNLIFEIEDLKTKLAKTTEQATWAEIQISLQLPQKEHILNTEPSPFPWVQNLGPTTLLEDFK